MENYQLLPQDLHIHTTWSTGDSSVAPEQTISLVRSLGHAKITGISDHFDYLRDKKFDSYREAVTAAGFLLGTEVDGHALTSEASVRPFDYYIYHCRDTREDYHGLHALIETNKPVIIAHPFFMGTDLSKVPESCFLEINNRYIWRSGWRNLLPPFIGNRRFIISSDAHQPHWLNQTFARYICRELGIEENILF